MPTTAPPPSARKHYALTALIAQRAATEAGKVKPRGLAAIARVLKSHQITAAIVAERGVAEMLLEQEIQTSIDASLNALAFTTDAGTLDSMLGNTLEADFKRLIASITQDAARTAESVATAVRHDIYHIRYVSPPCCGRCAVLAGRVYRYSEGFKRHPNCDCSMIPTTVAAPFAQSPESLFQAGQIHGLSKAETQAIRDGASVGQVVNVQRKAAGLTESGRVLSRAGRPTPEGIYRMTSNRDEAVDLLKRFGYVR